MISFAFHNPANISLLIDRTKFNVIEVFDDSVFERIEKELEITKDTILVFDSLRRLITFGGILSLTKNTKILNKYKVVISDNIQHCLKYKLNLVDAIPKNNGIWLFNKISEFILNAELTTTEYGIEKLIKKEFKHEGHKIQLERDKAKRKRGPRKPKDAKHDNSTIGTIKKGTTEYQAVA